MSKGNTFENDFLNAIFANNETNLNAILALTVLEFSLHTADPGEAGDQTTNEIAYTGYARMPVTIGSGFTVTANSVSPAAQIDFPAYAGGAGGTVTHFAIGTAHTGAGKILWSGTYAPNILVTTGITPHISASTAITED